jgi:arabinogalactan oligomer / maltooligosaccharide transport system substrate-binding protein
MKKKILLPLFLSLFVASCSPNNPQDLITLTVWEDDTNIEMLEDVAFEFSAYYTQQFPFAPKVRIQFIPESEGKAISNLILDGPSGNGPDIVAFVHDTLGTAVTNGLLSEVLFEQDIVANNEARAVQSFRFNNKLYGYPFVAESITLMYNKQFLQPEEVVSFESLKASGKKIALTMTGDGSAYYTFGLLTDAILFGAQGTQTNQVNIATPQAVDHVYELLTSFRDVIINTDPDTALALMQNGTVAGVVSAPYLWSSVKANLGNQAGIATLPTMNGQSQRPFSGYKGYGVSKYSQYPTIAHLFAQYLTREDNQYFRLVQKGYIPTFVGSSRIDNRIQSSSESAIFATSLSESLPMPNILAMANFWAPMQDAWTELWNNRQTITRSQVETILTQANQTILGG